MKTIITFFSISTLCFFSYGQINSNPGSYTWTNPAAWAGGVVPTASDAVIITSNSTILLDVPIVHNANIDINSGGVLASMVPSNDLTVNNSDLTLVAGGSQLSFAGSGSAVPVTINNGVLTNNGFYTSGDLYIIYTNALSNSVNNGDMMVSGTMTLDGTAQFDNNIFLSVTGQLLVNVDAGMANNQSLNVGSLTNDGMVANIGFVDVSSDIDNNVSGILTSAGGAINVGGDVNNIGSVTISDDMNITGSLDNSGSFTNNGGAVDISTNFLNSGTTTGSSSGAYLIAMNSENTATGAINGTIDVCDTTLMPGTYLDIDNNQIGIDFNTVTFCSISIAGIDNSELNDVLIVPNPTTGVINIEGINSANILLFSNDGRLIEEFKINGSTNAIDLRQLPTGYYTLKIDTENASTTKRIIKQ